MRGDMPILQPSKRPEKSTFTYKFFLPNDKTEKPFRTYRVKARTAKEAYEILLRNNPGCERVILVVK
jgi:hypothetical protein